MKQKTAFTLIELLVVIAIIAILAAILFPVFAQAREKARQASCTSNVKQLTTAMIMYTQDYDEDFPFWSWADSADSGGCYGPLGNVACGHFESIWFNAIYPYVKNANIYTCPDASDHSTITQNHIFYWTKATYPTIAGINAGLVNAQVNYGMSEPISNGSLCGNPDSSGCSQAALQQVAQTLLIADCAQPLTQGAGLPDRINNPQSANYVIARVAYPNCNSNPCGAYDGIITAQPQFDYQARHAQGDIVGFADGHAKWLRDSQIIWGLLDGLGPAQ